MMDVTVVIINFQTPSLLEKAVTSFKKFYPDLKIILIDNGSKDDQESKKIIDRLSSEFDKIKAIFLKKNIFHGPAMDKAIRDYVSTDLTFFLDSDTDTKEGGFLEKMVDTLNTSDDIYGVGEIMICNKRGYKSEEGEEILQTPYMMIKTNIYRSLKPFIHHGQPTLQNFIDAKQKGFALKQFNVSSYIDHLWRGTASKFGYGLGLKGKIDYILNKLGI
jgi:GT2 family glycosyltransferase